MRRCESVYQIIRHFIVPFLIDFPVLFVNCLPFGRCTAKPESKYSRRTGDVEKLISAVPEHQCKQNFAAYASDHGVHLDDADLRGGGHAGLKVGERAPDAALLVDSMLDRLTGARF
jgi:hypothetical protein